MRKRKILAMLLMVIIMAGIFAGCSNNSAEVNQPTSDSDDFPRNNIKILVGYSAGGSSDKLARILQPFLEKELGVSVVVENMPGASGQIAATNLMRQDGDGYTVLAVNSPGIYYTIAMQDTMYKTEDIYPLWLESNDPIVLLTLNKSSWNSLGDFIEAAKANPGKYSIGFAAGGGQQAIASWLEQNLSIDVNLVSYDGGGAASAALLGGHVDIIAGDAYARVDLVSEAKCLAIASENKNTAWPDATSFNKQLKDYGLELPDPEFQARYGAYWVKQEFIDKYPKRAEKLIAAFEKVAANEEYIKLLKDSGVYDSMVLKSGKDYVDSFRSSSKVIEDIIPKLLEPAAK